MKRYNGSASISFSNGKEKRTSDATAIVFIWANTSSHIVKCFSFLVMNPKMLLPIARNVFHETDKS